MKFCQGFRAVLGAFDAEAIDWLCHKQFHIYLSLFVPPRSLGGNSNQRTTLCFSFVVEEENPGQLEVDVCGAWGKGCFVVRF